MKLECFVPMYFFAKFIKFSAPVLSGKFEFGQGNVRELSGNFGQS